MAVLIPPGGGVRKLFVPVPDKKAQEDADEAAQKAWRFYYRVQDLEAQLKDLQDKFAREQEIAQNNYQVAEDVKAKLNDEHQRRVEAEQQRERDRAAKIRLRAQRDAWIDALAEFYGDDDEASIPKEALKKRRRALYEHYCAQEGVEPDPD